MSRGGSIFLKWTVLYSIVCLIFLIRFSKADIHLAMDVWYSDAGDQFFPLFTHLGDGIAFVVVAAVLFLFRRPLREPLSVLFAGLIVLLLTSVLKQLVFTWVDRPLGYFGEGVLKLIPGFEVHKHNSFPSGHSMAAFALYGILAFWSVRRIWGFLAFVLAASIAYSRIYLDQHFLIDVCIGGILGALIAWWTYYTATGMRWPALRKPLGKRSD